MSASGFVTPSKRKLRRGDVSQLRPNSEAVTSKMASSVNFLIDRVFFPVEFNFFGVVMPSTENPAYPGIVYVKRPSTITDYDISISKTGTVDQDIVVNVDIFDSDGDAVGTLWGASGANRVLIKSNGFETDNLIFGRDLEAGTSFTINQGDATRQLGELVSTEIPAASYLVPKIVSGSPSAVGLRMFLRLSEDI